MSDRSEQAGRESAGRDQCSPREFLASIYAACADPLYRYALMVLADHAAAEDVVQQAFARLARLGRRLARIESPESYLRTVVRNECYRLIAARRRRPQETDLADAEALLESADATGIDEDERLRIEAVLRTLPAEQREVVYMKIYEAQTLRNIAETLGVSLNTVASRYRYAIEKLRKGLTPCERDQGGPYER